MKKGNIFIKIDGGVGKHIMFTGLLPALAEKYESIYIQAAYSDVFIGNPYVTEINADMSGEFYRSVLKNEHTKIVMTDPYDAERFIKKQAHLLDVWAELCGVTIDDPMSCYPELYPSGNGEAYVVDDIMQRVREMAPDGYILVQFNGGQSPLAFDRGENSDGFQFADESMQRAYPYEMYCDIVKKIRETYPTKVIIRYGLPNEVIPRSIAEDVATLNPPILYKHYRYLCREADAIICIDSSLAHIAAAEQAPAVVIWGETAPEHFGWKCHYNLRKDQQKDTQPYCRLLGRLNDRVEFPGDSTVIAEIQERYPKPEANV